MTTNIWEMSATQAHELLRKKKISATEILDSCIERIEEVDGDLNALPEKCFDRARKLAIKIDKGLSPRTPTDLLGLPIAVKDYNDLQLKFRDAVKDGKIDKNANPYYLQKYKKLMNEA